MRVLMFGWEFPPVKSGGLGTACKGMATALARNGTDIIFVLPRTLDGNTLHVRERLDVWPASGRRVPHIVRRTRWETRPHTLWWEHPDAQDSRRLPDGEDWWERLRLRMVPSPLHPYLTPQGYAREIRELERRAGARQHAPGFRSVLFPSREYKTSSATSSASTENMVPTVSDASPGFFAPIYCPTITVPATVSPLTIMATRLVIWLPMFTPERMAVRVAASAAEKLPTTHMSTAP